ncbi:hypothetical protein Tco_0383433 [Tanacetum coccineum]
MGKLDRRDRPSIACIRTLCTMADNGSCDTLIQGQLGDAYGSAFSKSCSFLQQLQPEWSRFVTIVKQQHKLDEVSYHKLFDILKQYQKEVNELRAERMAKNANPLVLSHATTRYKGKEIAKPITPPSESASEEDSDPEQAQKDKDMQKNLALIAKYFKKLYKLQQNLRNFFKHQNKNGDILKEFGHYAKECRKPKRVKDSTYHKEKMLLCKQAEKGVQLQGRVSDWTSQTRMMRLTKQELDAHYSRGYNAKIQEVPNADSGTDAELLEQVQYDTDDNVFANDIQHFDQYESISNTCAVETGDSNLTPDSPDMCDNDIQNDQNDVECDDEHVALANLIANLKLDVDENKRIQKQLKKQRNFDQELMLITEFERFKAFNDRTVDYDKLERRLNETLGLLAQKETDIKESLKVKAMNEISAVNEKK